MKNVILLLLIFGLFSCSTKTAKETGNTTTETKPVVEVEKPKTFTSIDWKKVNELEALNKTDPRISIVDVYTDWCGPCKMMDRGTFTDKNIINTMSKDFHAVKFNAEGPDPVTFLGKEYANPRHIPNRAGRNAPHELSGFFQVPGYPTLVVLDENLKIIDKLVGYKTPPQLAAELKKYIKN